MLSLLIMEFDADVDALLLRWRPLDSICVRPLPLDGDDSVADMAAAWLSMMLSAHREVLGSLRYVASGFPLFPRRMHRVRIEEHKSWLDTSQFAMIIMRLIMSDWPRKWALSNF